MGDRRIIHLVDDEEAIRRAAGFALKAVGLGVETYASGVEFLARARPTTQGCVILDVRMPAMDGLEVQTAMAERGIQMPVIVLTGHGDVSVAVQAMKAGAVDFLTKPVRDQDLFDAVVAAIGRDQERLIDREDAADLEQRYARLSPRERQVMALVTKGRLNKQVAAELSLSEATIKIHRKSAMQKMKARTLAEWVRLADRLLPQSAPN